MSDQQIPSPDDAGDLPSPDEDATTGVLDAPAATDDLDDLDFEVDPKEQTEHDGVAPKFVVFDVGEVLVDETRVWSIWADIIGVSPLTFAAVLGAAVSQGQDHEIVFATVAPNTEWRAFEEEHERRYGGFQDGDLYTDARSCLAELRGMGFSVAIVGNQPARRLEQLIALDLPVDHVATSEDLRHEKPSPAFFDGVLELIGAPSPAQVLYVGDRVDNDVLPALAHGMHACWLRRGPWGQLQDLPDDVEPSLVLEGLGELPLLLQQWRDDDA